MLPEQIKHLAMQLPGPPGEPLPAGATTDQIREFEVRMELCLPAEFIEWLKFTNGACIGPGGMYGIRPARTRLDMEGVLSLYSGWPKGWVPIAGDGCGNHYVLVARGGCGQPSPVVFLDTARDLNNPAYVVASTVFRFLRFLFARELGEKGWPFDRPMVVAADPDLLHVKGFELPWSAK